MCARDSQQRGVHAVKKSREGTSSRIIHWQREEVPHVLSLLRFQELPFAVMSKEFTHRKVLTIHDVVSSWHDGWCLVFSTRAAVLDSPPGSRCLQAARLAEQTEVACFCHWDVTAVARVATAPAVKIALTAVRCYSDLVGSAQSDKSSPFMVYPDESIRFRSVFSSLQFSSRRH